MPNATARPATRLPADLDPELWKLFDDYVHGHIDRRSFLDRAGRFASVLGLSTAGLLAAMSPDFARAQRVPPDDARLRIGRVDVPSPAGHGGIQVYVARPAQAAAPRPVVLVVHENRGLNPHIEDVARRLALEGYIAVAPDALTPLGGYPGDEDKAREAFARLDQRKTREDFIAATRWAMKAEGGNGKLGVVGFCYGGGMANFLAARVPEVLAAAPFYGAPAPEGEAGAIKAELMLVFADNDERINAAWPPYEAALRSAGVPFSAFRYPGTQHGFHNDTTPRFNAEAAQQAWARTLALFQRTLA